jgi:hypothetical protein
LVLRIQGRTVNYDIAVNSVKVIRNEACKKHSDNLDTTWRSAERESHQLEFYIPVGASIAMFSFLEGISIPRSAVHRNISLWIQGWCPSTNAV